MRLLICTLYFPPCSFTPANRSFSWAKYLNNFGIYPVVITRQWPALIKADNYFEQAVGKEVVIEKYENYEVHYVPFLGNYRTRQVEKNAKPSRSLFLKFFVAIEFIFRYFFTSLLPYANLFTYALQYIKNNKVDKILISGSPFMLFKIGYQAKKRFNIPWIADYRDGWTTDNYIEEVGLLTKPIHVLNKYFEKKWTASASAFTTVSEFLRTGIEKYTGVKGFVVYNGFFTEENIPRPLVADKTKITFLYSGIVYTKQDYRTAVAVFKKLIDKYRSQIDIKLIFLGTKYANPDFANDPVFNGFTDNILLIDRVNYAEALKIHESADVFLMLTHKGMKGIVSSKIFDYIKYCRPVILFTNDHDVLEEILVRSNIGIIAEDAEKLEQQLGGLIEEKISIGIMERNPDVEYINSFSRENQAKHLAGIIKN